MGDTRLGTDPAIHDDGLLNLSQNTTRSSVAVSQDFPSPQTPLQILEVVCQAEASARACRRDLDLGSKYGLSPKLTERDPSRRLASTSCVAASDRQSWSAVHGGRDGTLTESGSVVPDGQTVGFPPEADLQVVVLRISTYPLALVCPDSVPKYSHPRCDRTKTPTAHRSQAWSTR